MAKVKQAIKRYFSIEWSQLWQCCQEVLWLTGIALLPLALNICYATIVNNNFIKSLDEKIIPGEILPYCLSFLASSLYILLARHQGSYTLPHRRLISFLTFFIYVVSAALYFIVKNNLSEAVNNKHPYHDFFFYLTIGFLLLTIILRVYFTYHGKRMSMSEWQRTRDEQQENFNSTFTQSLNQQ